MYLTQLKTNIYACSLPQLAFEPYTSTKTSILFAQKKTATEIEEWNTAWENASKEWQLLKTKANNLLAVYDGKKLKSKLPSIRDLSPEQEVLVLSSLLKSYITVKDDGLSTNELIEKYRAEIELLCTYDKDTQEVLGRVNTWWVFGEVSEMLNYDIFMAEAENIGYKRYKKNKTVTDKPMPNELFRTTANGEILIDDGIYETILDSIRDISWE